MTKIKFGEVPDLLAQCRKISDAGYLYYLSSPSSGTSRNSSIPAISFLWASSAESWQEEIVAWSSFSEIATASTSADAGTIGLGEMSVGGIQDPDRVLRLARRVVIGAMAGVLLLSGRLDALR